MLNDEQFLAWRQQLQLSEEARTTVSHIRSSPPARRSRSGARNVSGRFNQAWQMGHTVQYESRAVEWPAILWMEYDAGSLEINLMMRACGVILGTSWD
ncbi:MAG: hypothetical protein HYR55_16970 [Acidobacteria bacterium]|nr:hypothetical protein [Acidobacteriota bacterium]MBI3655523.1 hypothetical protein [Acidobacteriota bacterium]